MASVWTLSFIGAVFESGEIKMSNTPLCESLELLAGIADCFCCALILRKFLEQFWDSLLIPDRILQIFLIKSVEERTPFPNSGINKVAMTKKAFPWYYVLVYYGGMQC